MKNTMKLNSNNLFWLFSEPLAGLPEFESNIYCNTFRRDGDKYKSEFNIAGVKKEDIKVEAEGQNLVVNYKHQGTKYSFGAELPDDANPDNITAEYQDGILTVSTDKLNKKKEIAVR